MTNEALTFTDDVIEIPVVIGSEEYVLKEASGKAATKYKNTLAEATKFEDGKVSSLQGINDAEPLLVSLCLFTKEGSPVHIDKVLSFPNKVVEALFEKAQEISGLKPSQSSPEEKESKEGNG